MGVHGFGWVGFVFWEGTPPSWPPACALSPGSVWTPPCPSLGSPPLDPRHTVPEQTHLCAGRQMGGQRGELQGGQVAVSVETREKPAFSVAQLSRCSSKLAQSSCLTGVAALPWGVGREWGAFGCHDSGFYQQLEPGGQGRSLSYDATGRSHRQSSWPSQGAPSAPRDPF